MAIPLSSFLSKVSTAIPFLMYDTDLSGGMRIVSDVTERDGIHVAARKVGMLVFQIDNTTMYQLVGGTANDNFEVFKTGESLTFGDGLSRTDDVVSVDATHLNSLYAGVNHEHTDVNTALSSLNTLVDNLSTSDTSLQNSINTINDSITTIADQLAGHSHAFSDITSVPKVSTMPGVTISNIAPTDAEGEDGDIWFVVA